MGSLLEHRSAGHFRYVATRHRYTSGSLGLYGPERSPLEPLSSGRRLGGRDPIRAARRPGSETVAHGYQQKCQREHGLFVGLPVHCSDRIGLKRSLDWLVLLSSSYRFSATASG